MSKLLTQQDYYNLRVDKQKIYIDKLYTSFEWMTIGKQAALNSIEKRKLKRDVDELSQNSVTQAEFVLMKNTYDKEIRLLKNRVFEHERKIKKLDTFVDQELPSQMNKITSDMNEMVDKSNKERDEMIETMQHKTLKSLKATVMDHEGQHWLKTVALLVLAFLLYFQGKIKSYF